MIKSAPLKKGKVKARSNSVKIVSLNNLMTFLLVIVAFVVLQTLMHFDLVSNKIMQLLVPICYYIVLAVSLNLVVGFLGELSLGHAGFMCVGAYTGSLFSILTQDAIASSYLRFFLAFLVGAFCAAIAGFLIGVPVLRLKGDYLAIVTLAFGEIIKTLVNTLYIGKDSTGIKMSLSSNTLDLGEGGVQILKGAGGIAGTPRDATFTVGFILVMITLFIVINIMDSRTGRAIMSIRDNSIAAESVGINLTKYKLLVFTVSAALAGCAGVLYSHNMSILQASTNNFGYNMSIMILVYVVLGGLGSVRGSVIATTVLYVLPELLRELSDLRMLIYAIVLILMMIFNNGAFFVKLRAQLMMRLGAGRKSKKTAAPADSGNGGV